MSRPEGSKNVTSFAIQHPSRCKYCDSTRRSAYDNLTIEECKTQIYDENLVPRDVTHKVYQNTRCLNCNAPRRDVTFHNMPDGSSPEITEDTGNDFPLVKTDTATSKKGKKNSGSTTAI